MFINKKIFLFSMSFREAWNETLDSLMLIVSTPYFEFDRAVRRNIHQYIDYQMRDLEHALYLEEHPREKEFERIREQQYRQFHLDDVKKTLQEKIDASPGNHTFLHGLLRALEVNVRTQQRIESIVNVPLRWMHGYHIGSIEYNLQPQVLDASKISVLKGKIAKFQDLKEKKNIDAIVQDGFALSVDDIRYLLTFQLENMNILLAQEQQYSPALEKEMNIIYCIDRHLQAVAVDADYKVIRFLIKGANRFYHKYFKRTPLRRLINQALHESRILTYGDEYAAQILNPHFSEPAGKFLIQHRQYFPVTYALWERHISTSPP
ncbi:hypothetical protein C4573_02920 [Candidatus Woesearchaeota archaeon]|nr:MAG: hypothetical protein C4573_02920 [Candidatus Woesearchaeota archaeon]